MVRYFALRILLCQTGRRQPFFGGSLENPNKPGVPETLLRNREKNMLSPLQLLINTMFDPQREKTSTKTE